LCYDEHHRLQNIYQFTVDDVDVIIQTKATIAVVPLIAIAIIAATATTGLLAQHVLACALKVCPPETNPTTGNPHFTGTPGNPPEPTGNPHQLGPGNPTCSGNPHGQSSSAPPNAGEQPQCNGAN